MRDRVAESLSPMRCHWAKDWNPSDHYGDQGRIVIFRSSPYSHEDSLELMHSPCNLIARKLHVLPYHAVPVPPSRRWVKADLFDRADIFKLTNGDGLAGGRSVAQEVEVTVLGDDDGCVRVKIHEVGMEDDIGADFVGGC
jgi:hypothetical protein